MSNSTTQEQIAEVKRELAMRERVYPKFVASGRMKQPAADRQIEIMRDVLARLEAAAARVTPTEGPQP